MQEGLFRRHGSLLYWLRYTDGRGLLVEHCTGTGDLTAAQGVAAELGYAVQGPTRPASNATPASVTLGETLANFLSFSHLDRSAATVQCYQQKAGHLVRLLGDQALAALHVDHVHAYAQKRLTEGAARETVRKELCVLRSALQLARDRGVFDRAPAAVMPRFRAAYKPRQRWLSVGELSGLLRQLEPKRQRWVLVAALTGARLSELEGLRWGDLDFDRGQIHIQGTKTARSDRRLPLHPELAELLRPLQGEASEVVIGTWHNVRRDLALACGKVGIDPVTPNDLRRTFASWLKQAGRDSLAVGKLLGHTSSRMVELVYGHLDQQALRQTVSHLPSVQSLLTPACSDPK